ncbi:MAG: MBL fold metallo-hydrolase [bacterium]|nr:MBL fold metallo-hydrolase [bacterium]
MKRYLISFLVLFFSCTRSGIEVDRSSVLEKPKSDSLPFLIILGTVQDGGSPHSGCTKPCCKDLFLNPDQSHKIISLGLVDPQSRQTWLFDASPDLPIQLKQLTSQLGEEKNAVPAGIFLTHAHIGHYTGLMYLGREAMNAKEVNVYALPKMKIFLENNGPWSQLVSLKNITIQPIEADVKISLTNNLNVTAFLVPHRDEYSETAGFSIQGPHKKILFIPDIDKWSKWNKNIIEEIRKVDYAFIDGTFYSGEEINNRNIAEIPHPFVIESMALFKNLSTSEKNKIYFIHFNHTNPLLYLKSNEAKQVLERGFKIATKGSVFEL